MELIYRNGYGAFYGIKNAPNSACTLQLVVDTVGIFMSEADLSHLLDIVLGSHEPCNCMECSGEKCHRIWCSGPLFDICLKVDVAALYLMEDLIKGTQFILGVDMTLGEFHIQPNGQLRSKG